MRLQSKRVVVAGGAHSIGRAIAPRLAEEGATIMIGDIDTVTAERAAREIISGNGVSGSATDGVDGRRSHSQSCIH